METVIPMMIVLATSFAFNKTHLKLYLTEQEKEGPEMCVCVMLVYRHLLYLLHHPQPHLQILVQTHLKIMYLND